MKSFIQNTIPSRLILTSAIAVAVLATQTVRAQTAEELNRLRLTVEQMQKTIDAQNARIANLENAGTNNVAVRPGAVVETSPSIKVIDEIAAGGHVGRQSQVPYEHNFDDKQEAASRPKDYTLDPDYHGFIPIPNTPVLVKFNPKPHLDIVTDNTNPGSQHRFVPALFPLQGDPTFGGGRHSFVSANGTQLRLDVRAPEMPGDFRFYYQNDFFGSDTANMQYRVQHIYGEIYGFKAGFTYSAWEDPDVWPDTVDYEGPNAVIFARRPVAQYTLAWNDNWNTTFGVEQPNFFVDVDSGPHPGGTRLTRIPDFAFNTRYENTNIGHIQFSAIARDIGAQNELRKDFHVFGGGVNLSAGLDLTKKDLVQLLGVYGKGIGGTGNDTSFLNSDAAFSSTGSFESLRYWSGMAGYTHKWCDSFRSTLTYGYAQLDDASGQAATFYKFSHYASANLIWQMRKHLSVGLEGLYGFKEARNGADSGDHWRIQLGMVYSLFD
jgi:hypothetical protein